MGLPELWGRYKGDGDPGAKQDLVVHYLPLVTTVAARMTMRLSSVVEYDDLVGWGVIGLIEAVEKFDPAKGVKFETYAQTRIRGAIADGVRELDWVPRSVRQNARQIGEAYAALDGRLGRPARDEEVASVLGVSVEHFQRMMADVARGAVLSLDEVIQVSEDGRVVTVLDCVADPDCPDPLAECELEDLRSRLAAAIDDLPERERLIIALHYYEGFTSREIAEILGISEGRVSQLHTRALLRLRVRLAQGRA